MADVKVKFTTEAELQAAKAAEQQMERAISKAKILGDNYDDIAKSLAEMRERVNKLGSAEQAAIQPTTQLGKAIESAGNAAGDAAKKQGGLLASLKGLGESSPAIKAAIEAFKNPVAGVAVAAALLIAKVREYTQAIDQMAASTLVLDGFAGRIQKFQTLLADQRNRRMDLADTLNEIAKAGKPAAQALRDANDQLERKLRLEGNEDTANKAMELEKIDAAEAGKKITPEAAIKARLGIENKYAARKLDRENMRAAGIAQNLANAKWATQGEIAKATGQLPGAEEELFAAQLALNKSKSDLEDVNGLGFYIGTKRYTMSDALKRRAELEDLIKSGGAFEPEALANYLRPGRIKELDDLKRGITGFRTTVDKQESIVTSNQGRVDRASGRLNRLGSAITSGQEKLNQLGFETPVTLAGLNAELQSSRRVAGFEQGTRDAEAGGKIATIAARSQKAADHTEHLLNKIMDNQSSEGAKNNAMLSYLQIQAEQNKKLTEEINKLKQRQVRDPQ